MCQDSTLRWGDLFPFKGLDRRDVYVRGSSREALCGCWDLEKTTLLTQVSKYVRWDKLSVGLLNMGWQQAIFPSLMRTEQEGMG